MRVGFPFSVAEWSPARALLEGLPMLSTLESPGGWSGEGHNIFGRAHSNLLINTTFITLSTGPQSYKRVIATAVESQR